MKKPLKTTKHIFKFNTILIIGFVVISTATVLFSLLRTYSPNSDLLYIKVKVSQGLWWNNSGKPPLWYAQSINRDDYETDLFGKKTAEVLEKRYYPADVKLSPNQYDTFLTLKLTAKKDSKTGAYRYKRSLVSVGTPISFDLNTAQVTGSIMEISAEPISSNFQLKKLTLYNQYSYPLDQPDEYDKITVGDSYFDGTDYPVKILSKKLLPRQISLGNLYGQAIENNVHFNQTIFLEVAIQVKEIDGKFIYGEEQQIVTGASLNLTTNTLDLSQFIIASIE